MRKSFSLALSAVFLFIGVMIIVSVGSFASWYTGVIYLFLGGVFMKNGLFPKKDQDMSGLGIFKAQIFITDPFRAALSYFLLYYGAMSLLLDLRVISENGVSESVIIYLTSFLMVLFTYIDQLKKSKINKKSDA